MRITGPRKKSIFAGGTVVTARVVRTTLLMLAVGYVGFMARTVSDMANNGDADGGGGRGRGPRFLREALTARR
eukprot:scaffold422018_cov67-Attheya_sp.AAC.1